MKCYIKDYPRPQCVRTDWENLNGTWDFGFDDENAGEKEKWYQEFKGDKKINVPFTYETKLSGIQDETRHDLIWYLFYLRRNRLVSPVASIQERPDCYPGNLHLAFFGYLLFV